MRKITQEQADCLVSEPPWGYMAFDGYAEVNENGYVYGLENGFAILVSFEGKIELVETPEPDDLRATAYAAVK